jgi:hypothetical protein
LIDELARALRPAEREVVRESLLGWRAWRVVEDDDEPVLMSWWLNTAWPAGRRVESTCGMHGSRPVAHHMCGIHAFSGRDEALAYAGRRHDLRRDPFERTLGIAIGRVSGWGHAVRHARGWRSQYAYPYELFLAAHDRGLARALAGRYAVETWSPSGSTPVF